MKASEEISCWSESPPLFPETYEKMAARVSELEKEREMLYSTVLNAHHWLQNEPENDANMSTHAKRFLVNCLHYFKEKQNDTNKGTEKGAL